MAVKRFGVSLDSDILARLDEYIAENNLPNRSRGIRQLIENQAVEKKWQNNEEVAGAIVMVYDHHKNEVTKKANEIQHDFHDLILSTQHIHLNHDLCLETISLKGKANELTELANQIIALKGVQHGRLVMSKA